jgi:hypothetical protein
MSEKKITLILLLLVLVFSATALAQFDMKEIAVMQGVRDSIGLGASLAGIGDINSDGIEDLAVGQNAWNNSYKKTFIYFGSKNFDTIPDLTFSFYSYHISHGDINGDTLSDLLLSPLGKIYIYYGSISFDTIPDDSIVNNAHDFGSNFACGDINKDGYDDLAVYGGFTKVFVYLGGDTISKQPAYILTGPPNYFGTDGLSIGDINGDGYEDLAVSTSGHYPDDSTYIYFGGAQLDTIPRIKLKGGFVILGDVNGDGYDDLITGLGTYFGGAVVDSTIDSPLDVTVNARIIGNFNQDKYEDLLWGIPSIGGGDAYIYLGGNPLDTAVDWFHRDWEVGDYGAQVGSSDINGDGVDEAVVGDPGWWLANPDAPIGRVYIYKNPYTEVEDEKNLLPHSFSLGQNYPNPFNPTTTIPFSLKTQGSMLKGLVHTTLIIYNILGQEIRTLVNEEKMPGDYKVVWNGKNERGEAVGSGIYFYRIQAGSFTKTAKMSLLK